MLCIATGSITGPFVEKLSSITAVGFDAIELSASEVQNFEGTLEVLKSLIAAHKLHIKAIDATCIEIGIQKLLQMAESLEAHVLIVDPSLTIPTYDGPVRIARCAHDIRAALRLVEKDPDFIGLALSSQFMLIDGSRPAELRHLPSDRIFHVGLCDGTSSKLLPGQGTLNLTGFVRVLNRMGYKGAWSVNGPRQNRDEVTNAYRALVNLLDEVAQTEPDLRAEIPTLPPRVPAKGIEFIEFAVDEPSADILERLLETLSFRQERQHRTKKVTLWRQGAVNLVINRDPIGHARKAFLKHGPTVCDLGLRVENAQETVRRATALGADAFSQSIQASEVNIPAIQGVGDSIIHFIDENSNLHRVWDIEFKQASTVSAAQPAGIRRIDHIAQTMKYEEMQSWLLYYISTFEMEKTPIFDVADPWGTVRSQTVSSPEGEVRLNLNGVEGDQTFAGAFVADKLGAGVQHIAFLTDDIFETTSQLKVNGFQTLEIPNSYYVDLQAYFDLSDELTDSLQAFNLLYDRDENGTYFQLYSQPIFDGFFFEIVQRQGEYSGFGARNASVRLSAQTQV